MFCILMRRQHFVSLFHLNHGQFEVSVRAIVETTESHYCISVVKNQHVLFSFFYSRVQKLIVSDLGAVHRAAGRLEVQLPVVGSCLFM